MNREPLPVEMLVPAQDRENPLAVPPLVPATRAESCQDCRRRLNLEADPILDRMPAYRGEGESNRLLRILDSLESNERGQG